MKRIVPRTLPDGYVSYVQPFHVCLKGLETNVLCRDDDDYDAMVKVICVSAYRNNVIVIIYSVVSNHCHVAVLARAKAEAEAFSLDVKKVYSMWISRKYGERNILHRVDIKALSLDTEWYIRNALAYIPRNSLDNGCAVNEYKWSGYSAMFRGNEGPRKGFPVSSLTQRQRIAIMHTGANLKSVKWMLDANNHLIPESFCDVEYLEQAFERDPAFWLKTIGGQNSAEMHYTLEEKPYEMQTDEVFRKTVHDISGRWFKKDLAELSMDQKYRLVPYLYHTCKTTVPQLARVIGMTRERIEFLLTL